MARFRDKRGKAIADLHDFNELRDELKSIRAETIANLAVHLERFEANVIKAGGQVHWASDAGDVGQIVMDIIRRKNAHQVVKSKSMVTEEVRLNQYMEQNGIEVVETDLGEYIIQLAGESPSHIIAPAIHQTAAEVSQLFEEKLGRKSAPDPKALTGVARDTMRHLFLEAQIGISGVNLGVAETGSIVIVTNEGNGRMVTSLPPVHIAVMGIERLARNWDDAAIWLSLLARSATGQPMSIYTSVITGPARPDDLDGPEEVHIILLDHGRATLTGTQYEEVLQCIRCGACLGICPVYLQSGGHAYHSPYSGPIGAVVSPLLYGLENFPGLPQASTLCGACLEICPVCIDLPRMLLALRTDEVEKNLLATHERLAERASAVMLENPGRMNLFFKLGRLGQKLAKFFRLSIGRYPQVASKPFREIWQEMETDDDH
jgi:L-lactate dehydrogenase complex protein LldF